MASHNSGNTKPGCSSKSFWLFFGILVVIIGFLFHKCLLPQYVMHNNDSPLGVVVQTAVKLPAVFTGQWSDLNWLGTESPGAPPNFSQFYRWIFGNMAFAKFWTPLSLIILGLSAWLLFRALKLSSGACVLGGLAAALHGDYFSNACWGQQSRPLALAAMLLALAALQDRTGLRSWLKTLVAGLCVGIGIMEGFDIAALFSLVVAAYIMAQAWTEEGITVKNLSRGFLRVALVAGFSALVAAQFITGLVGTQIKGVAGARQDEKSKAERWAWATQWSIPKVETLSLLVPGLFGYRMDTPQGLPKSLENFFEGGQYWGASGRDLAWDEYFAKGRQGTPPHGFIRYGGAGNYGGPVILSLALWAVLFSLRKKDSPFTAPEKKLIWFWAGLSAIALLLAWGRWSFFYQLFYLLPYASTIRNPGKFLHIADWAWLMLFAYGVHAFSRSYWTNRLLDASQKGRTWRLPATPFERRWLTGSAIAVGLAVVGGLLYLASSHSLLRHLQEVQFSGEMARATVRFTIRQTAWFVVTLTAVLGVLALAISGKLAGPNAKAGTILLGVILVADLSLANLPWIIYWDWQKKYATNPIIERLRERPYEQRVVGLPPWFLSGLQLSEQAVAAEQSLDQLYRIEWAQHHFPYFDIQSLDVVQMPRAPEDFVAYESALAIRSVETLPLLARKWELTNTRYILALGGFVDLFNRQFDPIKQRFRVAERFNIRFKPGVFQFRRLEDLTAELNPSGNYALIEFTGALPRAKLFADWQSGLADTNALQTLADLNFAPSQQVLVSDAIALPPTGSATNQNPGTVAITSYQPKHIALQAKAGQPAVLLLNDRYTPNWQVWVDGKRGQLLRCNYLMRGVLLPPGEHKVEFVFKPGLTPLYVTCTGLGIGALVGLVLIVITRRRASAAGA
jgi:hypothetical protein